MALELKIKVTLDRDNKRFILTETTGNYSATNPGGWGSPNISRSTIESAIFYVTFPDGTVESINALTFIKGGEINKIISSLKTDKFVDGKYKFKLTTEYTMTLPGPPGDPIVTEIVKNKAEYDILSLIDIFKLPYKFIVDKIDISKFPDCECNKNILTLWAYLKALESSYAIENTVQSEFLYNAISELIDG